MHPSDTYHAPIVAYPCPLMPDIRASVSLDRLRPSSPHLPPPLPSAPLPSSRLGVPEEALISGFSLNLKSAMGNGRAEGRVMAGPLSPLLQRGSSGRAAAPSCSDAQSAALSDASVVTPSLTHRSQHPLVMAAEACAMSLPLCSLPPSTASIILEAVDAFLTGGAGTGQQGRPSLQPGSDGGGHGGTVKYAAVGAASLPALGGSDDAAHLLLACAALGSQCWQRGGAIVPQALIQLVRVCSLGSDCDPATISCG